MILYFAPSAFKIVGNKSYDTTGSYIISRYACPGSLISWGILIPPSYNHPFPALNGYTDVGATFPWVDNPPLSDVNTINVLSKSSFFFK